MRIDGRWIDEVDGATWRPMRLSELLDGLQRGRGLVVAIDERQEMVVQPAGGGFRWGVHDPSGRHGWRGVERDADDAVLAALLEGVLGELRWADEHDWPPCPLPV